MKRTFSMRMLFVFTVLSLVMVALPPAMAAPAAPLATTVFVNEIHYDNTSTDTGEAIEIAAPSGTNLTGWTIVLYNGNGGGSYDTDPLGTVDGTCGSYDLYVINYPTDGIQNGAPDGIALVDASNTVIQFLSYEGTFAATNGPADGQTSTDIGVSETGTTPVGYSLQLAGSGAVYTDFTWQAAATSTFAACNAGQTFSAGDVAPTVTSTVPTNGATLVSPTTTITLNFSEPVDVAAGAFTVECPVGIGVAFTSAPALPADDTLSVVLTPSTALPNSTICTVTAVATQITDNDGTADPMATDYVFAFTTAAADTAPTVSSTTPASGATSVALAADISITFSEAVTVSGTWYSISCTDSGAHTAVVSGGSTTFTLNPNADFSVGETCTVTIYAAQVTDQDGTPDNMAANYVWSFDTVAPSTICGDAANHIHAIQGSGSTSPVSGKARTIEGIVVGDYETGGMRGYFVQEENGDADADPTTSEGIFVYDNNTTSEVSLGDKVRVTGTVSEYTGGYAVSLTELGSVTSQLVCSSGNSVTPATVSLPAADATYLERFEGMEVTFPLTLTVTDNYDLGYYGSLTLSEGGKLWQFTHLFPPSVSGYPAYLDTLALRSILLDDGNTAVDPDPIIYPGTGLTALNTVRVGDTVTGLTVVLDQRYGFYRLQPIGQVDFTASNPRPAAPPAVGGNVKVGAFNTLNFFVTTGAGYTCGPSGTLQCRGATDAAEFTRQRDKLVAAICGLNADVLGLMELENPSSSATTDPVLGNLVTALNASSACPDDYAFIDNAWAGTDAIRQGIIYKPTVVTPVGTTANLNTTAFINGGDSAPRNRPALTQAFEVLAGGERFIVVVNHLKSKGSACDAPDALDGQGNCAVVRTNAANALTSWLAGSNPTGTGDPDVLIVGDLNSYAKEAPITALAGAGYTDLVNHFVGSAGYSYGFDGMAGYLDHALANSTLLAQTLAANEWHINSDEPDVLDYNLEYKSTGQQSSLYNADAYRSTDHDPVLVGLGLYPDRGDLPATYGQAWHTGQGALRLGALWTGEASSYWGSDNLSDDGVRLTPGWSWNPTDGGKVDVTVTGGDGYLTGWIDWNLDGDFEDAGEQVFANVPVTPGLAATIAIAVPVFVGNLTFPARFRLYPAVAAAPSPTGRADGGEVEDYTWCFGPNAVTLASFGASAGLPAGRPLQAGVLAVLAGVVLAGVGLRRRR